MTGVITGFILQLNFLPKEIFDISIIFFLFSFVSQFFHRKQLKFCNKQFPKIPFCNFVLCQIISEKLTHALN